MKKIGIITWYYSKNFGSQLQAYALSETLKSLNCNPVIIEFSNHSIIKNIYESLICKISLFRKWQINRIKKKSLLFVKKHLRLSYVNNNKPNMWTFDTVICGSDQIWAPNLFKPRYMLDFVPDSINKISYAASIGLESIPLDVVDDYKKYISRINYISVRENRGQEILRNLCGINSTVVLDPTLLLEKKYWDSIKIETVIKEKYVFCYFLNKNHQYKQKVQDYAKKNGYEIYGISENLNDNTWMHTLTYTKIGPCEFIGLIENAQFIVTDSYHGTIFSLLYHKEFALFERFSVYDKISQNSRIEQLKYYFGIDKNIFKADETRQIGFTPIDYDAFDNALFLLREKSLAFLKKAIG